jgi:hypothetical protein
MKKPTKKPKEEIMYLAIAADLDGNVDTTEWATLEEAVDYLEGDVGTDDENAVYAILAISNKGDCKLMKTGKKGTSPIIWGELKED